MGLCSYNLRETFKIISVNKIVGKVDSYKNIQQGKYHSVLSINTFLTSGILD